jgi:hypothetical protein
MSRSTHPVKMVEAFIKVAAQKPPRPYRVSDTAKPSTKTPIQQYAQPNPSTHSTNPTLVASQKAIAPPPVM